jgi:hypothetical protein
LAISTLDVHCGLVAHRIRSGSVVPLLGAGANLCDRTKPFTPHADELPSGGELAEYLSQTFGTPVRSEDLVHVAQYIAAMLGSAPLYDELHRLFGIHFEPNRLHRFLASLPKLIRATPQAGDQLQLIVTTNYDDALETAFAQAGEPFDLVTYVSDGEFRGRFAHRTPSGELGIIERANEYVGLAHGARTVILKIHGAIDRENPQRDSFVITEDDYIDYLTRTDVSKLLPPTIVEKLRLSHILFLGYSLRDWNLRAIFHRLWQERTRSAKSWAVQRGADAVDSYFWQLRGVEILDIPLGDYVDALEAQLRRLEGGEEAA